MKKIFSLTLALVMLASSSIPASAKSFKADSLPETGVIISDDFESYNVGSTPPLKSSGGILYRTHVITEQETNGNKYVEFPGKNKQYITSLEDLYGDKVGVRSGKVKIQYDVRLPKPTVTLGFNEKGNPIGQTLYLVSYGSNGGWSNDAADNRAYLSAVKIYSSTDENLDNKAYICFNDEAISGSAASINSDGSNYRIIDFDKWYTVTTVIDYDSKEAFHYINGEKITYYKGTADAAMAKSYEHSWLSFNSADDLNTGSAFQMDNFLTERLGEGTLSASFAGAGNNYVDVDFSGVIEQDGAIDSEYFTLKKLGEDDGVIPASISYTNGKTMRFTFDNELEKGINYQLFINAPIHEVGNNLISLPENTAIFFATEADVEHAELVEQNFEDVSFPESAEEGENFEDFTYYGKKDGESAEFVKVPSLTSKYISKESDRFSAVEGKASVMKISHNDSEPANTAHKTVFFPFADGREITSGTLTAEFDMYVDGDDMPWQTSFAFGLHDSSRTGTSFNRTDNWSDATLFFGLTDWSHKKKKAVVPALADNKAYIPSYYLDNGKRDETWSDRYKAAEIGYSATITDNLAAWHTYKLVADISESKFELYLDGKKLGTYNYFPGNATRGTYDGFVIESVNAASVDSELNNCYYIDNVKVSYDSLAPMVVEAVDFEDCEGKEKVLASTLPAGVKNVNITFSKELDSSMDYSSFVEVEGAKDGFTCSSNGKVLTIDLTNCLLPSNDCKIALKSGIEAAKGALLANDVTFKFATDGGAVKFFAPVIKKNDAKLSSVANVSAGDSITAEVNVINTTADGVGAYVVLLAYKDGYLAGIAHTGYVPTVDRLYSENITASVTASDGFVGADSYKAIVFDTLSGVHPLADACEVLK